MRIEGEIAGRVTSGGFGYTVGRLIAYAYVPGDPRAEPGRRVEVEASASGSAAPAREPLYDAEGARSEG